MKQDLAEALRSKITILEEEVEGVRYAVEGKVPSLVALPSTEEEVAACLAEAARHGAAVALRGGGSKGNLGNVAERLDLVVSLERLDQVVEYVPADLVITAQAGMRFADLQALVAQNGQTVPIDPPRMANATIGGVVAAASMGPYRMAYGGIRDILLGTRVAMTDGKVIKTGGRVVKNVAGYDMNKLLVGSLGTLGAMTEISLKLRPLPVVSKTVRMGFSNLASGLEFAEVILNAELLPSALVVLSPGATSRCNGPGTVTLAVALEETGLNVAYQEQRLAEMATTAAGLAGQDSIAGSEEQAFWEAIRNYGDRFGAALQMKVNTVVSDLGHQLTAAAESASGVTVDGIAYLGSGTMMLYGFTESAETNKLQGVVNAWFNTVSSTGGSAVLESAPLEVKRLVDVWGPKRPQWRIMEGIKRTFDPGRMLNPGRYVGGL